MIILKINKILKNVVTNGPLKNRKKLSFKNIEAHLS